jgi:hypothetical protein
MAVRYIIAPLTIPYGMYAELVLRNEDAQKISDFIAGRIAKQ